MPSTAVFASTDLSTLRLLTDGGSLTWSAAPTAPGSDSNSPADQTLEAVRARVSQAADWIAADVAAARQLSLVCLDIDQTSCLWLRSPSREEPAVIAAARAASQDWGASLQNGSFQGLWDDPAQADESTDASGQSGAGSQSALASLRALMNRSQKRLSLAAQGVVISIPDAIARLWLDALDERGVRVDRVLTLWHAMAIGWSPADPTRTPDPKDITGVILLDRDRRAVWAWAREGELLAGGQIILPRAVAPREGEERLPEPSPALAASRLSMDWLTWSTQLGSTPTRFVIVGPKGAELAKALSERWPGASTASCIPSSDPIDDTVNRAEAEVRKQALDSHPRRVLVGLTHRPTRAVRARYRWFAVALVLLALSLAALAWRMQRASVDLLEMADRTRQEMRLRIESLNDPALVSTRSPLMTLESELIRLRAKETIRLPEPPRPIHTEIMRALAVLSQYDTVRLTQLNIDSRQQSQLQVIGLDRRMTEELAIKLEQLGGSLAWSRATRGGTSDQPVMFNGIWIRSE